MAKRKTLKIEKVRCIVCDNYFSRYNKKYKNHPNVLGVKKSTTLTCSRECSKIYALQRSKIFNRNYRKNKNGI